jgi:hypothetical protein
MKRRISYNLKKFFDENKLTDSERNFIIGCIKAQQSYPQLTNNQWKIVKEIESRYRKKDNG